jgi:hypothetical protein
MTWEVGQEVAILERFTFSGKYKRALVTKVYADGGVKLDDGSRWTARNRRHGGSDTSRWLGTVEEAKRREDETERDDKFRTLRRQIDAMAYQVTDIGRLERALAVLNEGMP